MTMLWCSNAGAIFYRIPKASNTLIFLIDGGRVISLLADLSDVSYITDSDRKGENLLT